MKRVKDETGMIHFSGIGKDTICGKINTDLLGRAISMKETPDQVTCQHCATLYCRIKNAPWNEVDNQTMETAMYAAVKE